MSRYTLTVTGPRGEWSKPLPSATEIIDKVLAKTGLPDWYYKQAVNGFSTLLTKYEATLPRDIRSLHQLMKDEGVSPYAIRDTAADMGDKIHKAVEKLASGRGKASTQYPALDLWWNEVKKFRKPHIIASEATLYSTMGYGGTLDLVYKDPETSQVILADIKTGKARDSHALQLEMYRQAWDEMHGGRPRIESMEIIQVPRDGGEVCVSSVPISSVLTDAVAGILAIWRWL